MVGVLQETPSGQQANPRLSSLATGDTRVAGKCGASVPRAQAAGPAHGLRHWTWRLPAEPSEGGPH